MLKPVLSVFSRLGKANIKTKTLIKNVLFSLVIKGGSMIVAVLTMPAYLRFFDNQIVLGLWFTALSVLSWFLNFDLGIGNGLRNYLVEPISKDDKSEAKCLISSAYFAVCFISILLILLTSFFIKILNWNDIFKVSQQIVSSSTLQKMMQYLVLSILTQLVLRLIFSILYAMQKSALVGLLSLISNVGILLYVSFAQKLDLNSNIINLSKSHFLLTNLPLLMASIIVFVTTLKGCAPSLKFFKIATSKKVLKLGGVFLYLQIMTIFIAGSREILITSFVNTESVVEFQIYNKYYTVIATIFGLMLAPLWSAITQARVENDFAWIRRICKKSVNLMIFVSIAQLVMVALSQQIFNVWLGKNTVTVNYSYGVIFCVFNFLYMWQTIAANLSNGLNRLKSSVICLTAGAVVNIVLSFLLTQIQAHWLCILIANICAMIPYAIFVSIDMNNKLLQMEKLKDQTT